MATKNLTSEFRKSYGMSTEGTYTLDESTEYLVMCSDSNGKDWFIVGAASSKKALDVFFKAAEYCASYRTDISISKNGDICCIKSTKTGKRIMIRPVLLGDDSYTIDEDDDSIVTMSVDRIGRMTYGISAFAHQENRK